MLALLTLVAATDEIMTLKENLLYRRTPLVREVLDANDNLRSIGLGTQFDFPAIVVIGDQSAGKSSVLEAISGVPFLRGAGVVTRAPVELRLEQGSECQARVEAQGVASKSVPCAGLGHAINETMRDLIDKGSRFRKGPSMTESVVRVKVSAAGVPDLTLVDLPGLARVAVEGQSADVPRMTRDLAKKYIASKNTIILVVVPCNADLATAEALNLAAEADPEGSRTVGVLTKPDLMDPGTEDMVSRILDGRVVNLKDHGYFVVRNRGQRDRHVDEQAALLQERNFFRDPPFANIARDFPGRFGVTSLVRYLTKLLVERIVREIPELRAKVEERILAENQNLANLGSHERYDETASSRKAFLLQLTTEFTMSVRETTRGHYDMLSRESAERGFMADLLSHYKDFYDQVRARAPRVNSSQYDAAVYHAVTTQHGREAFYGFPSYAIFTTLVRDLVGRLHEPADRCASLVRGRVLQMARAASADLFAARFPKLRRALDTIAKRLADERHDDAHKTLSVLLDMQMQPFTQELLRGVEPPDEDEWEDAPVEASGEPAESGRFFGRGSSTGESFRPRGDPGLAPRRKKSKPKHDDAYAVDFVKAKIDRYFTILAERVGDLVPMAIDMYLVQKFGHDLALRVANATHALRDHDIADLLRENAETARKRTDVRDALAKLNVAREVIDDFSSAADIHAFVDDDLFYEDDLSLSIAHTGGILVQSSPQPHHHNHSYNRSFASSSGL